MMPRIPFLLLAGSVTAAAQNVITTFAGSNWVFPTDPQPAITAPIGQINGVAVDSANNVYVCDTSGARIYKVDSKGILTIYAGNGSAGYSGDGGPATAAALNVPRSIAFDPAGNLFIADEGNARVRKVTPAGIITTYGGTGDTGYAGDGGPATAALLSPGVIAVTTDISGNVYIADRNNNRVRKISTGGIITTVAGNGTPGFSGDGGPATAAAIRSPSGLATDSAGNLYFSDSSNNRVRRVANGIINTIAGTGQAGFSGDGGAATSAQLNTAMRGLAVAPDGTIYIADSNNFRIRKFSIGGAITTVAGIGVSNFTGDGGPATSASISFVEDIALASDGRLFLADFNNLRLRVVANGAISTFAGNGNNRYSGDGGPATNAVFGGLTGISHDKAGNLYVADEFPANRIRRIDPFGIVDVVSGSNRPGFGGDDGPATQAMLNFPLDVKVDASGNLFIADSANNRIRKVSTGGVISTIAGTGAAAFSGDGGPAVSAALSTPAGLAFDSAGNLYVSDQANHRVRRITSAGIITTFAGNGIQGNSGDGGSAVSAALNLPANLAFDAQGNLYIADQGAHVIRKITSGAISAISTFAGNSQAGFGGDNGPARAAMLNAPQGVATDSRGSVYIADTGNFRVRQVLPDGTMTTIAGNNTSGLSGDGGFAPDAQMQLPYAVDVDSAGLIYISDFDRVRIIRNGPPPLFALSQTGATFTVLQGGGTPLPQNLTVLNNGAGTLNWTASATTTTITRPTGSWLSVSPSRGSSTASASSSLTVIANPAGLAEGAYYGLVQVTSPGIANSPQFVTVVLNVLSTATATGPAVQPTGLIFTSAAAQTVQVAAPGAQSLTYTSSIAFTQGSNWLSIQPASGSIAPNQPAQISFQPNLTGLSAGVYAAAVTLNFSDGTSRRVDVLLVVNPAGPANTLAQRSHAAGCTPTRLNPVFTLLGAGFSATAGWPISLEAKIVDDCGQPMTNGAVTATFTNNDPPLAFSSLHDGRWSATWAPRNATQVGIALDARTTAPPLAGSTSITGLLATNPDPPLVASGGVLNAASYALQASVAPGALVSIFGAKLSQASGSAQSLPLVSQMNGTTATLAGRPLPLLFTSDGQVNAMLPYDLAGNASLPLIVQRGTSLSLPEPVPISTAQPAIFTRDLTGKGQAIVVGVNADGSQYFAAPESPATAGSVIVIYCAGLGAVQPTIAAGLPAPFSPLSQTSNPVTVTIGGITATVLFSGLTPAFTGLYQVNAVVPAGVTPGDAVPIRVSVSGQTSPTSVTIAVR